MDITIILILVALNAVFAMSELAVVSSRTARLQHLADEHRPGAKAALTLQRDSTRFLSTVQVGITSVGVLAGAVSEDAIAEPVAAWASTQPWLAQSAEGVGLVIAVVVITYLSVVLGELVPKRVALLAPERIALVMAAPMGLLSRIARPIVWLLSRSSDVVLALLPGRGPPEPPVTDREIAVLMEQGAEAGVFHESEQTIVTNVLRLDERKVTSIMTPRQEMDYLDLDEPQDALRQRLIDTRRVRLVVCRGGLDDVHGFVETADLLADLLQGRSLDVAGNLRTVLRIPESATTTTLLETFREEGRHFALVTDEYGEVEGIVTDSDLLEAIVGDIGLADSIDEPDVAVRTANTWLVDGGLPIEDLQDVLDIGELPGHREQRYSTVAGFVLHQLGHIPRATESFEWDGYRFEVVDMDRRRVDKVLVERLRSRSGWVEEPS